jgi:hypothetical protein
MTDYKIAQTAYDYKRCHGLLLKVGRDQPGITFPTIMAEKDGELTGVLCTHISNKMIFAGPVAIRDDAPHYWTFIRLIEAYENVMRTAKITTYLFAVPKTETKYLELIEKVLELKPYGEAEGHLLFDRRLT